MQPQRLDSHADGASIVMEPAIDRAALLPSSHWLSLLPAGPMRQEFTLNCGSCHGIVRMHAHSLDLDTSGNVWVNDHFAAEERIAKVDARTGDVTVIGVPRSRRPASEGIPLPYGLQVDGNDRLHSTQLAANTLVVHDTRTGEAKPLAMPAENSGPRRPVLAPDGSLWIPEFNTGHITRFSPETEDFDRIYLGMPTIGAYDIEVDQRSGIVWTTGSLDSSLFRYDPSSGRIDRMMKSRLPASTPPTGAPRPLLKSIRAES